MPLTQTVVKALKPHPERHRWVNDGAGPSYFTIGEWPDITVKAARRARQAHRAGHAPERADGEGLIEEWFAQQSGRTTGAPQRPCLR